MTLTGIFWRLSCLENNLNVLLEFKYSPVTKLHQEERGVKFDIQMQLDQN